MSRNVLERIAERTISESDLRAEISRLGEVAEPPAFWLDIANDPTYTALHRALAICQFFKRHLRPPVNLVDLARLLGGPDWLNSGAVTSVEHLKGEIPVEWNVGETVLAIRPFSQEAEGLPVLYLRLSQPLPAQTFVQIMKSLQGDVTDAGASVLEAACVDG